MRDILEIWGLFPFVVFGLAAASFMGVWVYKDAKSRGMKAGLWTLLSLSGDNCSGLLLYLIFRRKSTQISDGAHKKYAVCFATAMAGLLLSFTLIIFQLIGRGF